jgi:phosphoglycerate kinase
MPEFTTLDRIDPRGKKVLVRVDLNVPTKDGRVTDRTRIDRAAATLRELAERGGRVIVLSHFGRPKGKDPALSLQPLIQPLSEAIGRPLRFASDCIGPEAERVVAGLKDGEVALLENLRFHAGEEKNAPDFVAALARLGDLYVNDAFSAAHRAHASTEGLAHRLPTAAGRLMQEELEHLSRALDRPERPLVAIVGGAKVSTKIDLLTNLVAKVDALVIGGAMANTFLCARGFDIGESLAERELTQVAREVEARAAKSRCRILLPEDAVVAPELKAGAQTRTVPVAAIPRGEKILDIGPASIAAVKGLLEEARSLVWNGPVGAFETPPFDAGTLAVARKAAELTEAGRLLSVAGGGDTVAALAAAGVGDRFSYVSTAGGAFLEWLEGKTLPGVAALAVRKA